MSGTLASALTAVLLGVVLVVLLFIPYVAWTFRRLGYVSPMHALVSVAAAVQFLALWTYTLIPIPENPNAWCAAHQVHPQLRPFAWVGDLSTSSAGPQAVLAQVVFNVLLFMPAGALAAYLWRRRVLLIGLLGFGTSLVIELTQLTGVWGIFPCAYRLFDVDDLIANTLGAVLGALAVVLIGRWLPKPEALPADRARTVKAPRRLLGMLVDVASVLALGFAFWLVLYFVLTRLGWDYRRINDAAVLREVITGTLPTLILLFVVPFLTDGPTLGQRLVLLRPVTKDGDPPGPGRTLLRALAGSGGFLLLSSLNEIYGSVASPLLLGLALVSVAAAIAGDHRGLSGYAAGLRVVDARDLARDPEAARWSGEAGLRSMTAAVVIFALLAQAVVALILGLLATSSVVATIVIALVLLTLAVAPIALSTYLVLNGLAMVRKEGRRPANLLSLLAGLAGFALLALMVAAVFRAELLLVLAAPLLLAGYFGVLFWAFLGYGLLYARRAPIRDMDAVVVLGSGIFGTRVPPLLASRLDRGQQIFEKEVANGHVPLLVTSGGQGPGEDVAEAIAMRDYLLDHGMEAEAIVPEDLSRNTEENLRNSAELIQQRGLRTMVVVTNDFHAFRAALLSRRLGLTAQVVGSPTARYFFPSAVIREFVGVIVQNWRLHLLVSAVLVGLAVLVSVLVSRL